MAKRLKIAICGAGITGICLSRGLSKYKHLDVTCYEASATFRDEGAAIGLGGNAQEALRLIDPKLREALGEAGGTPMVPAVRVMIVSTTLDVSSKKLTTKATGKDSGKHVGDLAPEVPKITVHRSRFLGKLEESLSQGILKMGKKLQRLSETKDGIILTFEDGSSERADGVVACDGINSVGREFVLGAEHPAVKPVFTGGYNHRVVIPLQAAKEAFGEDYCSLVTQHGWIGDGGFLLTDLVDDGTSMQVIAGWSTKEIWPHESPFVPWPKERIIKDLEDWGEVGKAMTKVSTVVLSNWLWLTPSGLYRASYSVCCRRSRSSVHSFIHQRGCLHCRRCSTVVQSVSRRR
jgi:salicylate hydroxylase